MEGLFLAIGGFMLVFLFGAIIVYVLGSVSYSKAFKAVDYSKPWIAWIPVACLVGLTDAALDNDEDASKILFGKVSLPKQIVNFWILLYIGLIFIPKAGTYLAFIFMVLVLGPVYAFMYAKIEGKTFEETRVLGYISAGFPIIPFVKWIGLRTQK